MTTIFIASLSGPTYTGELYEYSNIDLVGLSLTQAFLSEAAALAWAIDEIEQRYEEEKGYDGDEAEPYSHHTESRQLNGDLHAQWSQHDDFDPEYSFGLVIAKQEL